MLRLDYAYDPRDPARAVPEDKGPRMYECTEEVRIKSDIAGGDTVGELKAGDTVKVSAHRRDQDGKLYGRAAPIAATGGGKVGWVPSDCLVPWRPDASMLGYYATGATAEDEPRLASRYDFTRPSFRRYLLCQHTFIPVAKRRFVLTRILENQHWTGILTGF